MKYRHVMPFGAQLDADGARFRLWAPDANSVVLKARSEGSELNADLNDVGDGWFELSVGGLAPGARYVYRIDEDVDAPDPASRFNPQGVAGGSLLSDPSRFEWREDGWRGRDWREAVIYEMHVGCFTREGTYAAASERLAELAQLGVTAVELMPLACFPGERGWGYDGVLLYAPHYAYGEPDDLKRFIEAAHAQGVMVLLDVVYNHFGPLGNYLPRYASAFFTSRRRTPWGDAINFAHPVVRQFFIHNALYWLEEYRFDGLRIDAVHAMYDDSPRCFIDELIDTVEAGPGADRRIHVVLENERNEAKRLRRRAPGVGRSQTSAAQWNDDFHHALHVILTKERDGYYIDYADQAIHHLGRVLAEGFAYQGERSTFSGEPRGEPSADLPPTAFVAFLQNHDQVGNRAFGERIARLVELDRLRAAAAVLLLAPQIPMMFMGGEYAASQPFLYFCDYEGDLADAVRTGRRAEFGRFSAFAEERARAQIPDPNARATFEASRLDWTERSREPHASMLEHVRNLLRLRRERIEPCIPQALPDRAAFEVRDAYLHVNWPLRDGATLSMHMNFGDEQAALDAAGELIYASVDDPHERALQPWEVRVLLS
jgi:maltooligosyltrehalose trehalohydrolase